MSDAKIESDNPETQTEQIENEPEKDEESVFTNATEITKNEEEQPTEAIIEEAEEQHEITARDFSENYFLSKHSPSFVCLQQCLFSSSDLKLTLSFFPVPLDPGLEDALNYVAPEEEPSPDGSDKYIRICKELNIVPITRVIRSLATDTMNLKFYGLTLNQMRGISAALKVNSNVKYLIFQDNWMCPSAVSLISEILSESNSIIVLNLQECRIGEEGAEKLCEGISSTQFLQELDLSYNSLGDAGLKILQPSLIENGSIKKLNLSNNNLTDESCLTLEQIVLNNKCLEDLDLSWSGFYTAAGNKKMFNAFAKNELIHSLNLSWNGIGTGPAMRPISKYLRKTTVLQNLDLSWNRITQNSLRMLRGALIKNKTLVNVKVGDNLFTPDEAFFLATGFRISKNPNLLLLDMENMCVNKDFLQLKNQIRRQRKIVTHGHVLCNFEIFGPNIKKLLFERCKYLTMKAKKKKKRKDFGHFVLALPEQNLTPQEFEILLKKKKIRRIDKDLLKELLSQFPAKHKKVDCPTMKSVFMQLYPDARLPPEKKKKKKKRKKKKKGKKNKKNDT